MEKTEHKLENLAVRVKQTRGTFIQTGDERVENIFVDGHVLLLHELQDGGGSGDVAHVAVPGDQVLVGHAVRRYPTFVLEPEKQVCKPVLNSH